MPMNKVTRKKCETTTEEFISVIEKKNAEGKTYGEIAEITGISKLQAAEIVKE
jgi:hypothetical protein